MIRKARLSASVDSDVLEAAERASSRSGTLSAWVNEAMRLKLDHDRRLQAFDAFLRAYESEHGEITEEEMTLAARAAQDRAVRVRSRRAAQDRAVRVRTPRATRAPRTRRTPR